MLVSNEGFPVASASKQRWDKLTAQMVLGFTEWSQGFLPVEQTLRQIVSGFGAERGTISRVNTKSNTVRIIATTHLPSVRTGIGVGHSFAHPVLGEAIAKLKPGSLILMTEVEESRVNRDPDIEEWLSEHNLADIGLICLRHTQNWVDYLELYFSDTPNHAWSIAGDWGATAFARTYKIRRPGLVTEAMARRIGRAGRRHDSLELIMAAENATGLTRSEWRVCVLVSRGLTAKAVAAEIGVATSTVRTHLRKIYGKTNLSSYHQLARRLVSPEEQAAQHRGMPAKSA